MDEAATISLLGDLLHVSKDGEETFGRAKEITDDETLKAAFETSLESCAIAAQQLVDKIEELGGRPAERGTVPGAFGRTWLEARSTLSGSADKTLLEEIVRAERAAVKHYDEAMAAPLGDDIRGLVTSQAAGAKANLRRFEGLTAHRA
jgi:uncharacterized protein (TIGR02284 family)